MANGLWSDPIYREIVVLVLGFLFLVGLALFLLRKLNAHVLSAWLSLKSWLLFAPLILLFLGFPKPWPFLLLVLLSLTAAKFFFQITGMFHRSNFVWMTYLAILVCGYFIFQGDYTRYLAMPMIYLASISLIPVYRNSYKHMIQYMALSLMNLSFLWGFMHIGFVLNLEKGPFIVIYMLILTELSDNFHMGFSRFFHRWKIADKISSKRSVEGLLASLALTLLLAWGLRHLLPVRSEVFWATLAIVATLGGALGDLVMNVIRRDLGIKVNDLFILGRSDYLSRFDRLIFVAPIFYHAMVFLAQRAP